MTNTGTAYSHLAGHHDPELTEVGKGTPMGELMRRYWQPVGTAIDELERPIHTKLSFMVGY